MYTTGDKLVYQLGTAAGDGAECADWGDAHLHQSENLVWWSYNYRNHLSGDTCWVDDDSGGPCSSHGTYRDHVSCPWAWSGYASKSGNITEYICELWSAESRSHNMPTFIVKW